MQTNLKTLSRQYANGVLTKTEYRRARAELIESAQDCDLTEPQATLPAAPKEQPAEDGEKEEPEPGQAEARPPPRYGWWWGGGIFLLVALLALLLR